MVVYLHILLGMRIANALRSWGIICFCYGHRPCIAFYFILKISTNGYSSFTKNTCSNRL